MTAARARLSALATTSSPRAAAIAVGCYLLVALGLFGALGLTGGWLNALLAGAALAVGATVPGAALVRLLMPHRGLLHLLVLGTTLGLMLWSLGGLLSHLTGSYAVRWAPSAVAVLLFVVVRVVRRGAPRPHVRHLPPVVALGGAAGILALVPAVRTALLTQPASWDGWFRLYGDLPFHVAIASEVATRAPQQDPWVAGTPLSYTWAYHSAMGVWSSTSTVSPNELVLQAWPVLFAVLIPGLIAIIGWELSRSAWVAALAPLVFTLAHGVLMAPASFVQNPLFTVSPTRDYGHLATLVVVLALIKTLRRRSLRAYSVPWLVTLGLGMLVATAVKGSLLPVLLGGLAAGVFILLVSRRFARTDLLTAVVFGAGALTGFAIAIPDSNSARSLSWGPLTFLDPSIPNHELLSVVIVVLLLAAIVGVWLLLGRAVNWTFSSVLAGVMLAGVLGLALFAQWGGSQNYFWQAAEPLVSITITWCAVILCRSYGRRVIVVILGIVVLANLAVRVTTQPAVLFGGVVVLAAAGALVILRGARPARPVAGRVAAPIIVMLLLTQAAQLVGPSFGYTGGVVSTADDESATHSSQLAAFDYIREHSGLDDVVATNSHCLTGSLAGGDCVPQRFILAAVSERRVLVEGWSYTQFGDSTEWVQDKLDASDGFIEAPSAAGAQRLESLGVRYVYVDLRLAPSADLGGFADLVFDGEWGRVYELRP